MVGFNSRTGITFSYVSCNLPLHSSPLEILLQVLVHRVCSRMDRIPITMCFIHYLVMLKSLGTTRRFLNHWSPSASS
jgi:hypothetical protein